MPLRTFARPSPFRRPVLPFGPPREPVKIVLPQLPASLPWTWRRVVGTALVFLASFALFAMQAWTIFGIPPS